jgi:hypothetical protein
MKVIFLDIDGVLNCKEIPNPSKFLYIVDEKLLRRLERLLKQSGAKVVLSLSWRVDPVGVLAAKHFGIPFTDVCSDMPSERRCIEMRAWLLEHPQVSRYSVIDDEDDGLDDMPLFQPSSNSRARLQKAFAAISQERRTRPCAPTRWCGSDKTSTRYSSAIRASRSCDRREAPFPRRDMPEVHRR